MKKIAVMLTVMFGVSTLYATDLVGKWNIVESWGAMKGIGEHKLSKDMDKFIDGENKFSFEVTSQSKNGNAFSAEKCSKNKCETIKAVIRGNGEIIGVDDDGYMLGTIIDADRMELCYLEAGDSFKIAVCHLLGKK